MSILTLPRPRTKRRLLAEGSVPVASSAPPVTTAPHLAGSHRNRVLWFDDIRRLPDPVWARPAADTERQQAYADADAAYIELRLVDVEENVAVILAAVAAAPFVRHESAFAMVLAPIAAMLAEVSL